MKRFVYDCEPGQVVIAKARKPVRSAAHQRRVESLSKTMARAVHVDLLNGIKTFKRAISYDKMYDAWLSGDYSGVMRSIPFDDLPEHISAVKESTREGFSTGARLSLEVLPPQAQTTLRYDTANPKIEHYLQRQSGELITRISEETRQNISSVVRRTFDQAYTPRDVANQIKDSIGLLPRQERALQNYRTSLRANKAPEAMIGRMASQYADRLLDARAMTIARSETRFALNNGQLAVWQQAADQDLIDRATAQKVWVIDGNPCVICEPMDGVAVLLNDPWVLPNGVMAMVPTDAHPNCYCTMTLDFGQSADQPQGDPQDDDDRDQEEEE